MHENPRIPEAQVSLLLAMWLIDNGLSKDTVSVSIDGAMVRVHGKEIFNPVSFLADKGWQRNEPQTKWSGTYCRENSNCTIHVHSRPGEGDVTTVMPDGRRFIAECKKGNAAPSRSNPEYSRIREALGQILTMEEVNESDILAITVPSSIKSVALAMKWRRAPLVKRAGIKILTIDTDGNVVGFDV
ncbi:MAG: hypothetical protein WBQ23_04305 [Bacteroidota bacterium]